MALRSTARTLRALAARFYSDRRGSIAIFIAAAAVPLIGALGLATDTARGYLVKSRLAQALDAAALAGGKDMDSPTRNADIQKFFTANFPNGYMDATLTPLVITPDATNTMLTVSATATVPTTFMRVLGFDDVTVAAATEVKKVLSPALDVVLSIDLSGSMGQPMTKISSARTAAKDLVDSLWGSSPVTGPTTVIAGTTYHLLNIGLVPWNHMVNVTERGKPTFSTAATFDETVAAYTNPYTLATNRKHRYYPNSSPSVPLYAAPSSNWTGCVLARYVEDSPTINNSKDGDLTLGLGTFGLGSQTSAWVAYDRVLAANDDDCLPYKITPLQTSKTVIKAAIDELLVPRGSTMITQGLFWAWEVLMPGKPYDHGLVSVPYARNRAIVLLTDGQIYGSAEDAYKGAFGNGESAGTTTLEGNLPVPPAVANTKNNLNNRLKLLAQFIKAQGILIYVVQFDEISPTLTTLLSSVATEPNSPYYFNAPTTTELQVAFKKIAGELSRLRIAK